MKHQFCPCSTFVHVQKLHKIRCTFNILSNNLFSGLQAMTEKVFWSHCSSFPICEVLNQKFSIYVMENLVPTAINLVQVKTSNAYNYSLEQHCFKSKVYC